MSIQRQETKQRMSRIVIHNDTVYLCGQVGKDSTKDIAEQTETMLEKVDELLLQAGSDREHMLSATVYVRDMKDFAAMNDTARRGAIADANELVPVTLSDKQFFDLIEFLHSLTDRRAIDLRKDMPDSVPSGLSLAE